MFNEDEIKIILKGIEGLIDLNRLDKEKEKICENIILKILNTYYDNENIVDILKYLYKYLKI